MQFDRWLQGKSERHGRLEQLGQELQAPEAAASVAVEVAATLVVRDVIVTRNSFFISHWQKFAVLKAAKLNEVANRLCTLCHCTLGATFALY